MYYMSKRKKETFLLDYVFPVFLVFLCIHMRKGRGVFLMISNGFVNVSEENM